MSIFKSSLNALLGKACGLDFSSIETNDYIGLRGPRFRLRSNTEIFAGSQRILWKGRFKRTSRKEAWENKIKHAPTEQMEEAVAVWPARGMHFTSFMSHKHTHTLTQLSKHHLKTFWILKLCVFREFQWVKSFYLLSIFETCFLHLFIHHLSPWSYIAHLTVYVFFVPNQTTQH